MGLKVLSALMTFGTRKRTSTARVPDIRHAGIQAELRKQGYPVWGSGRGMILEQDRVFFMDKLAELGLDVPPYEKVTGLTNLALFLKDKEDI